MLPAPSNPFPFALSCACRQAIELPRTFLVGSMVWSYASQQRKGRKK